MSAEARAWAADSTGPAPELPAFGALTDEHLQAAARVVDQHAHDPEDLADLLAALDLTDYAPEASTVTTTPPPADPDQIPPLVVRSDDTANLLTWGQRHETAGIRALTRRAESALAELAGYRERDAARAEAERRVAELREQLAAAENDLRTATGRPGRRTPEQLAKIRAWARENGHEVSGHGMPPRTVLDAYDAAHADGRAA